MAAKNAEAAEAAAASAQKPKKPKMMIAIAVVTVLVLMIAGKSVLGGGKQQPSKEKKPPEEVGITIALDEFLVNLSGGGDHYLKTAISLGLRKGVTEDALKEKTAPVRDAIVSVLSSRSLGSLGSEKARDKLKEELKSRINEATGDASVLKVYFTSFATQ
jgi:flagellar FliL protein